MPKYEETIQELYRILLRILISKLLHEPPFPATSLKVDYDTLFLKLFAKVLSVKFYFLFEFLTFTKDNSDDTMKSDFLQLSNQMGIELSWWIENYFLMKSMYFPWCYWVCSTKKPWIMHPFFKL